MINPHFSVKGKRCSWQNIVQVGLCKKPHSLWDG